ncbi:MAG TPA: hypothetical protein VFR35_04955, partial [Actinoplanes sp.]|nr:hypothetical protein [Actinoplanes sp.]
MGSRSVSRAPILLRPVLVAADRMRTSLRLGVLVLVLMVPGVVAAQAYLAEAGAKIAASSLEVEGAAVLEPALLAMADTVAGRPADLSAVRAAVRAHPVLKL